MSDKEKVSIRLKSDLLNEVKEIMDLKGQHGENSKAIRKALKFYRSHWKKPIQEFEMRFDNEDKEILKKHLFEE